MKALKKPRSPNVTMVNPFILGFEEILPNHLILTFPSVFTGI